MAAHAGCGINAVLHVEVLSKVLQHVDLRDRLLSCSLVCSLWRKAAAMSIVSVDVPRCSPTKTMSLSAWLSAHAAEVKLDSISVTAAAAYDSDEEDDSTLILPLQQLTALRTLKLKKVHARTADTDGDAGYAILDPALLGLARLDLLDCKVWLKGLHCLNGLQHLAVQLYDPPAAAAGASGGLDNIALLQQAIPDLTHLTALHLRGAAAHDTALEHLSTLACLQELELTWRNNTVTQASFKELPCSLTRLRLRFYIGSNLESDTYDPGFHFSPNSTPGLCRLTALQELEIHGSDSHCCFHVSALPALPALRKLALSSCPFIAGNGEPTLSVLTALTNLEHLEMPSVSNGVMVLPADYAAITASPQLTHLDLSYCSFDPEHAKDVFSDNLRLPKLLSLRLTVSCLLETETIQRVVDCCPGLAALRIESSGGGDVAEVQPEQWAARLGCLAGLSALTRLSMTVMDISLTTEVYRAIGTLTGLQELSFDYMDANHLGPAVQLTSCRQLTNLSFGVETMTQHDDEQFGIYATNKAPAGSPPDVWRQIPSLVLQSAANYLETGEGRSAAVKSLLRAAAQASSHTLQRETELEERVEGLEQQVAELQASMAAVLQHLQLPAAHHA